MLIKIPSKTTDKENKLSKWKIIKELLIVNLNLYKIDQLKIKFNTNALNASMNFA